MESEPSNNNVSVQSANDTHLAEDQREHVESLLSDNVSDLKKLFVLVSLLKNGDVDHNVVIVIMIQIIIQKFLRNIYDDHFNNEDDDKSQHQFQNFAKVPEKAIKCLVNHAAHFKCSYQNKNL